MRHAAGPGHVAALGAVVGGIYEVVYTRVLRGEIQELPVMLPDLAYSALLPYLGLEAAREERARLTEAKAA